MGDPRIVLDGEAGNIYLHRRFAFHETAMAGGNFSIVARFRISVP